MAWWEIKPGTSNPESVCVVCFNIDSILRILSMLKHTTHTVCVVCFNMDSILRILSMLKHTTHTDSGGSRFDFPPSHYSSHRNHFFSIKLRSIGCVAGLVIISQIQSDSARKPALSFSVTMTCVRIRLTQTKTEKT